MKINFHIISLFPETIKTYVDSSILGRAQEKGLIKVSFYNPRDFSLIKGERIDDRPFGGGPGMVISALPVILAWEKATKNKKNVLTYFFSPSGDLFNNCLANEILKNHNSIKILNIVLICGRYEGIDARVIEITKANLISVGDFILTGGEIPAMIMIDTIARKIPGVLGRFESLEDKRVAGALVYTRPNEIIHKKKKYQVPEVLLSGHHQKIDNWKKETNKDLADQQI